MNWPRSSSIPPSALQRLRTIPPRWFRLFVGFADHPKWRRVAKDADADPAVVIATVVKLLETANAGRPRGSVADFSPEEWSLSLGIDRKIIDRIWHALEAIGWIDREYVTKWDTWQPDKEDPTHRERQTRYRERKRAERRGGDAVTSVTMTDVTASRTGPLNFRTNLGGPGRPSDAVTSVTVTPRAEQKVEGSAEGNSGQLMGTPGAALDWLYGRCSDGGGLFAVMRGCGRGSELYARNLVRIWLAELHGDADTLMQIVRAVDGQATGADYEQLVGQHVTTARDQAAGSPRLPLPPTPLASNGGG